MSKDKWKKGRKATNAGEITTGPQGWGTVRKRHDQSVMGGVCSGLAHASGYPVWAWRILFLLGLLVFGLGGLAYVVLGLLLKSDPEPLPKVQPMFRKIDWWTFGVTTFLVMVGYLWTLAPDLTLEDSGELAVGSFYAGVPHPPGYPVWTLYTWFFTVILPFSNIAWRVAVSSAVAGALSSGLIALLASRGSSMILESIEEFRALDRRWENALCMAAGYVSGMLIGFNGFMWSQAVIVEVYTLSVLSLALVLCFLLRWIYAPDQRRYLYWALFLFGICFTNHQTLILAAMGIEVAIAAARPKLGRDLFMLNSLLFVAGLFLKLSGQLTAFDANRPLFMIYLFIGVLSIAAFIWLTMQTKGAGSEIWVGICMGLFWLLGASFYFYMPIASMTNPPLNWGYPRTWEGFMHALTRGQYESTNPTSDIGRFLDQMQMLLQGAVDEFNLVYLLIGIIVFFFFRRMQKREQAWLLGLLAMYLCLAVLLIVLLNPSPDRQSTEMNRVFFTASHLMITLFVGYGLSIFGALMITRYQQYRSFALYGGAIATAIALYSAKVVFQAGVGDSAATAGLLGVEPSHDSLVRFTALFSLAMAIATVVIFAVARKQAPMVALFVIFLVMPFKSVLSHWANNEQRGHLFGYWFGHDMFAPPFDLYSPMAKDAILFGGTDPGRFAPTYMIFAESFTPARCKPRDPDFDRRDVYIITQNALADGTYLNYIRAHYFRSDQIDPPFFQDMFRSKKEIQQGRTNLLARMVAPLDHFFTKVGERIEAKRRAEGVYPPKEIYTPSPADHSRCMTDYFEDARQRLARNQLKRGEYVSIDGNDQIQVSGQVAVMAINALLTKVIFDKNPDHEFYVEESFPLEWMFPYLEPYGIILKINREPLPEISEEKVAKDHEFWREYSERLIGDWITYDTTVAEICDFALEVYLRRDFTNFKGDRKFIRDDQAQKSFSKLRSAIGGVYSWRIPGGVSLDVQQRMAKEADFAFRQAFAFCPYSPEAVIRYTNLLASQRRFDDAVRLAETALQFDPGNPTMLDILGQLQAMQGGNVQLNQIQLRMAQLQQELEANPTNADAVLELADIHVALQRTNSALGLLDQVLNAPDLGLPQILKLASIYASLRQTARLEATLQRLIKISPESPEPWYDLACTQLALGRRAESITSLRKALVLNDARLTADPNAYDLRQNIASNPALQQLNELPEILATPSP